METEGSSILLSGFEWQHLGQHLNHQISTQQLLCGSGCLEDKGELRQSPGL